MNLSRIPYDVLKFGRGGGEVDEGTVKYKDIKR